MSQQDPQQPPTDPSAPTGGAAPQGTPASGPTPPPYPGTEAPGVAPGYAPRAGYPGQPGYPAQPGYPGAPAYPGQPGGVDPGRGLGTAGLVLSCIFFIPLALIVGIILSAVARSKSKKAGFKNPQAAWGLGLGIGFLAVWAVIAAILIAVAATHSDEIGDAIEGASDPTIRAFCQADADLTTEMNALQDPSATDTSTWVEGIIKSRDDLAAVEAPAAIADDWDTIVSFFDAAATPLESVDANDPDAVAKAMQSNGLTQDDLTDLQTAGDNIDDWASTHCAAVPVD
ncbi:MAG TPA: hypothetical protein VNR17_01740 [Luteimicrobium sp.]|nr:hypothetical protein [Luteimicrobium sp.]